MATGAGIAPLPTTIVVSGRNHFQFHASCKPRTPTTKSAFSFVNRPAFTIQTNSTTAHQGRIKRNHRSFSVRADYDDRRGGGGGDFVAGFLLGGAICGTLAYVFAPQIRRSLLNEDEYGFRRAKRPIYYDEGLEKTRQTLNEKISQLNSAIDNVSSRLRGGNNMPPIPVETDPEEATM